MAGKNSYGSLFYGWGQGSGVPRGESSLESRRSSCQVTRRSGVAVLERVVVLLRWSTTSWFRLRFLDSTRYLLKVSYTLDVLLHLGDECSHCDSL